LASFIKRHSIIEKELRLLALLNQEIAGQRVCLKVLNKIFKLSSVNAQVALLQVFEENEDLLRLLL